MTLLGGELLEGENNLAPEFLRRGAKGRDVTRKGAVGGCTYGT